METQTIITLLTIAVILLSTVMVALLAIVIVVLVKLQKIAQNLDNVMKNVAAASEWLTPAKVFGQIINLFRK
jgi:uncharacterized protein YoxC